MSPYNTAIEAIGRLKLSSRLDERFVCSLVVQFGPEAQRRSSVMSSEGNFSGSLHHVSRLLRDAVFGKGENVG